MKRVKKSPPNKEELKKSVSEAIQKSKDEQRDILQEKLFSLEKLQNPITI